MNSYVCEHCVSEIKWTEINHICPECAGRSAERRERREDIFPLRSITRLEHILVKIAPLGRLVTDVMIPKGATVSQVLDTHVYLGFIISEIRINGRPATTNTTVNNGDVITLIPSLAGGNEDDILNVEIQPVETPSIPEISVKQDPKIKPVRRSRFEGIIE